MRLAAASLPLSDAAPASTDIAASSLARLARLPHSAHFPFFQDHRIDLAKEDGAHRTLTEYKRRGTEQPLRIYWYGIGWYRLTYQTHRVYTGKSVRVGVSSQWSCC